MRDGPWPAYVPVKGRGKAPRGALTGRGLFLVMGIPGGGRLGLLEAARMEGGASSGATTGGGAARIPWAVALLMLALSLFAHLPAVSARFTFDDRLFVEQNDAVRELSLAPDKLFAPFPPADPERGLFRPVTALSYSVDYRLGGGAPEAFHRMSLLYYLALLTLVYALGRRWLGGDGPALVAALAFSLHPVHCEVVDSIAGRSELLALLFSCASLLAFDRALAARSGGRPSWPWLGASLLAYALAALSKETAVLLPVILAGQAWAFHRPAARGDGGGRGLGPAVWALPAFALIPPYLLLRFHALGRVVPGRTVLGGEPLTTWLATVGAVIDEYARLMVFPGDLGTDFAYQRAVGVRADLSPEAVGGMFIVIACLCLTAVGLSRLRQGEVTPPSPTAPRADRALFFGLFAAVFWAPVSHVVPFGALMAERFLFSPSLGLVFLAVHLGWDALSTRGRALRLASAGVTLLALLALGGRSRARAADWYDEVTLWTAHAERFPEDHRGFAFIAGGLLKRGDPAAAIPHAEAALKLAPEHLPSLNNLALAYQETGRLDIAEAVYQRVTELDPDNAVAWNNLGVLEMSLLRHSVAVRRFERALAIDPHYATAQQNLAASRGALALARAWLDEHPPSAGESAEDLATRAQACTVVGDDACARAARGALAGRPGDAPSP